MKWKYFLLIACFVTIYCSGYGQKQGEYTFIEKKCIQVFKDFQDYIKRDKKYNLDITSDTSINYVLLNYLFIDRNLDSSRNNLLSKNVFKNGELERFKKEFLDYVRYFQEKSDTAFMTNIEIIPMRVSEDTFIYNQMTNFQKANTYAIFDKRIPDKTLFYILFIPPIKDRVREPRIWSWILGYQFGKFVFTCPNGEVGYEYIFP